MKATQVNYSKHCIFVHLVAEVVDPVCLVYKCETCQADDVTTCEVCEGGHQLIEGGQCASKSQFLYFATIEPFH